MFNRSKSYLKTLAILLCSFIFALTMPIPIHALTNAQWDFFNANGIYYYDPQGGGFTGCYVGDITVQGSTAAEKIWTGLTTFLTDEQAAGVMGNMVSESGFNPVRHEMSKLNEYKGNFDLFGNPSVSYGIGLIQWSFGRRINLLEYIKSKNSSLITYFEQPYQYSRNNGSEVYGDKFLQLAGESAFDQLVQLELEFLKSELQTKFSGFMNTTSVYDAAKFFLEKVEIPQNPYIEAHMNRVTQAEEFYNKYHGFTPSSGGSSSSCTPSGNFQQTVLNYAWHQHYSAPYTDRMPDYAAAVAKRNQGGKYVGGSVNGIAGIDCGGFVTTLMQDSGFAPDYNGNKGGTSVQEQWVKDQGWKLLNGSPNTPIDTGILQPGDVAFTTGHTFVYVGNITDFNGVIASALIGNGNGKTKAQDKDNYDTSRAPMAGTESLVSEYNSHEIVRWYRKN